MISPRLRKKEKKGVVSIFLTARINDISTNLTDPPRFDVIARLRPKVDYAFPATTLKDHQNLYPDLKGLKVNQSREAVLESIVEIVKEESNWELAAVDLADHRIEFVATTPLLRFKDDVVIEVRPGSKDSCVIEVRSKSRLGRSDLGANERRIQHLFDLIDAKLRSL